MRAEILFPELCNLFAEQRNMQYLRLCAPGLEFTQTHNTAAPLFASEDVGFIYLGSLSEQKQRLAHQRLQPYAGRLGELIQNGTVMLFTGNAYELLGKYIQFNGERYDTLGIFDFYTVSDTSKRHNSHFLGTFEDIRLVGNKSQYSFTYGDFPGYLASVQGGIGHNPGDLYEGIRAGNLLGTHLLGPLLINNPPFTKKLLRMLKQPDTLAFEDEVNKAYQLRLGELTAPGARFAIGEHG